MLIHGVVRGLGEKLQGSGITFHDTPSVEPV